MSLYETNREWSDKFLPAIRAIVGPKLLVPSPIHVDMKEAADLIVLKAKDMTVAARVRRSGYADRYPYEFTIRSKVVSGTKTELAKLLEGWGDWFLYGHEGAADSLSRWWLIDLHEWRERLLRAGYKGSWEGLAQQKSNGDGTSFFAFDLRKFKPSILVAGSAELPNAGVTT